MSITQRTVAINDFGLARRERTTSAGTSVRYTVSIEADPLLHVFDAKRLGAGPAMAIAEHLQTRIGAIGVTASPSTLLKRKYARSAMERGARWATKRYSGGKIGTLQPDQSDKLFNDSSRLVKGLIAKPTRDNQWVINVAANRLDPSTFEDGEAGLVRMVARLRELVPEFGDANALAGVPVVRQAIGESVDYIFVSAMGRSYGGGTDLRARVRANQLEAIRAAIGLLGDVGILGG